jgi:hypothetical protein
MQSNYNNECIHHLDPFTTFLNWINYAITLMFLKYFQKFIGHKKSHISASILSIKNKWVFLHVSKLFCPQQTHDVNNHYPLLLILGFSNQTKIFIIVNNNNL